MLDGHLIIDFWMRHEGKRSLAISCPRLSEYVSLVKKVHPDRHPALEAWLALLIQKPADLHNVEVTTCYHYSQEMMCITYAIAV